MQATTDMSYPYKIVATVYRMYQRRGLNTPYFRTCMTIIGLLFLHVVVIGLLFRIPSEYIFPGLNHNDSETVKFLKVFIGLTIAIALFFQLFKKKKVDTVEVSESDAKRAKSVVIIYFLGLLILMTILLVLKGVRMGLIHL
jgi:hypothetical protein